MLKLSNSSDLFVDAFGNWHQLNPRPFVYNDAYLKTYDLPEYRAAAPALSTMRLAFVHDVWGGYPPSLLDFGYGRGDFLRACQEHVPLTYGFDVSGVPPPTGSVQAVRLPRASVYTFWDSLEHVPTLDFLTNVDCHLLCASVPVYDGDIADISSWKHYKPDEHVHYFSTNGLLTMMHALFGWDVVALSTREQKYRQDILTVAFRKHGRNAT